MVTATVTMGERPARTRFRVRPDATVDSHCPCHYTQDRGLICFHVVAVGHLLVQLTEDPVIERRKRIATRRLHDTTGGRAAARLHFRNEGAADAVPAVIRLRLDNELLDGWQHNHLDLVCHAVYADSKRRLDKVDFGKTLALSEHDINLLYAIEDMGGTTMTPGSLTLARERFLPPRYAAAVRVWAA